MIIDSTYFERYNFVANVNEPDPDSRSQTDLDFAIQTIVRYVLSFTFGAQMFNDLKQYYSPSEGEEIPQNYKDLVDGKAYSHNGTERYWIGLRQQEIKESLLADLVYYAHQTNYVTQSTGIGEVSIDNKIGNKVSIAPKVVRAWNSFLNKYNGAIGGNLSGLTLEGNPFWIFSNRRGIGIDYCGHRNDYHSSLIQFLEENKEDFPLMNLQPSRFFGEFKNEFGI